MSPNTEIRGKKNKNKVVSLGRPSGGQNTKTHIQKRWLLVFQSQTCFNRWDITHQARGMLEKDKAFVFSKQFPQSQCLVIKKKPNHYHSFQPEMQITYYSGSYIFFFIVNLACVFVEITHAIMPTSISAFYIVDTNIVVQLPGSCRGSKSSNTDQNSEINIRF